MATLVGAALREGRLPNIDARLGDLLPQHRSIMDARTERITVRQLLSQTAGYTERQTTSIPIARQLVAEAWVRRTRPRRIRVSRRRPTVASAVIAEVAHQTTLNYARRVLFEPLDIQTRPHPGTLRRRPPKAMTLSWTIYAWNPRMSSASLVRPGLAAARLSRRSRSS